MDSCMDNNADRPELEVDHQKKDYSSEISISSDTQLSSIEEREHLQVYLRIRPFTSAESSNGESQDCVALEPPDTVLLKPPSHSLSARMSTDRSLPQTGQRFQFSQVYGPETTQRELFEGTVKDLVKDVLEGENSLVFTYGVTNAGKTFTFLGPGPDADAGILPRCLDVIFSNIDELVFPGMSIKPHRCREFTRLTREQQAEEVLFKRNLFKQLKENERSNASILNSTKTLLEAPSILGETVAEKDKISLEVEANTKFSVWVSFCEIYNENIHDLLEVMPSGAPRRTVLRLSQDVKGNSFVKDLHWVQVNTAEEAYKVMKLGKRNQSFSSTRLNQLSSRSHSIFSIRILRIEDVGTPRVHAVSEMCLCDLAGSERCAKTQNQGDRLKEAGNINTSLLTLGKCITALRHNQQAKLLHHVPFRESKLTHYLQSFFCGRGKACMIVNINQCASMYDETLNVLKFSAVAQKVVVLSTRPPPSIPQRSACEPSITNNGERKPLRSRRSSLIGWESSLEDVQEDVDNEYEEDTSLMDITLDQTGNEEDVDENGKAFISKEMHQKQVALLKQLQMQLKKERVENLLMEARVREEISREFSELFSEMQNDYNDRLGREREILEERAEQRLEIFKKLIHKMATAGACQNAQVEDKTLDSYSELAGIKVATEAAHMCLCAGQAGALGDRSDAIEELDRKILELKEHQQKAEEQTAHKHNGGTSGEEDDGKRILLFQLQEQSSQIASLEKEVEDLRRVAGRGSQCHPPVPKELTQEEKDQLQEALTALEKEKKAREDALSALEFQTIGKEEALASLKEESQAREAIHATLKELRESQEETLASLEAERKDKEKAITALADVKQGREEALAALEEARCVLETERKEVSQLETEKEKTQQEVQELTAKLEAAEFQVRTETERAEQALVQLQTVQLQLDEHLKVTEEKTSQIQTLVLEAQSLKQLQKTSDKLIDDLKQKFNEQVESGEHLKAELEEFRIKASSCSSTYVAEEELKMLNSGLQTEVKYLKEKPAIIEDTKKSPCKPEDGTASLEMDRQLEEKLAVAQKASAEREAELQKKLEETEAQVTSLQKNLKEAQEKWEEEESQAVQDTRRKEVERRRELLAVAHEAIAQKDEEMEKKAEEISRLKENAKQDSEKVKSLHLDIQRKEDENSDLREKLADYKKQIQQVQKEISAMREEEKVLRQKLSDVEKAKKQLQSDLTSRDRTIQQLKLEQSSEAKSDQTLQLYQKSCKDLEAKERIIENMRFALTEQEQTQEEMEKVLEEKLDLIQELSTEVEKLKGISLHQGHGNNIRHLAESQSDDLKQAKQNVAQAQESLKFCTDKYQAERKKWVEEKLFLIGQAKEAEDKRNQEMRKFAEDRERYTRQQSQLESLSAQLTEKEQAMEKWRKERDTLVAALEVQLQKLLSSQAEKEKVIRELQNDTQLPQEGGDGCVTELQAALREREAEIQRLKEELMISTTRQTDPVPQTVSNKSPATSVGKAQCEILCRKSEQRGRNTRASASSQGSAGCPSVLDSSEISTENGRTSRFPRPELEISFSPLQPNRMALRRQGEESAVTVKITRPARKRKSSEMETEEVENPRNMRTRVTPKLPPHHEEISSLASRHDSSSSIRSRKEGTLQKIGDFLQSSPTLLGTKAKKMMSLVSGRGDVDSAASSSSLSLRAKKNKRKLYRPEISSPMDMPSHPIISREPEDKDSDHQIIKRRLRSRVAK
ncbi:kinesin-like protein KIF20B isoform X2 [Echeneis naucrates]|uniref:kinesin-like protein KIF20B isoform X2 n=1 Tax=Echeneis naucrates TaxID=173247 RepID=UPI00111399D2|nr:kinesin-like protein KIF20B isoform X2 [Echeneis naucrates]